MGIMTMNVKSGMVTADFPIILVYSRLVCKNPRGIRFLRVAQSYSGFGRAGLAYLLAGQFQKKEVCLIRDARSQERPHEGLAAEMPE